MGMTFPSTHCGWYGRANSRGTINIFPPFNKGWKYVICSPEFDSTIPANQGSRSVKTFTASPGFRPWDAVPVSTSGTLVDGPGEECGKGAGKGIGEECREGALGDKERVGEECWEGV